MNTLWTIEVSVNGIDWSTTCDLRERREDADALAETLRRDWDHTRTVPAPRWMRNTLRGLVRRDGAERYAAVSGAAVSR